MYLTDSIVVVSCVILTELTEGGVMIEEYNYCFCVI